jgi:hypothetical protein
VRLIADDRDGRSRQRAELGEAREGLLGVDAGVPERDLRVVLFDDDRPTTRSCSTPTRAP